MCWSIQISLREDAENTHHMSQDVLLIFFTGTQLSNALEIMRTSKVASKRNLSVTVSNICVSEECQAPLGWHPIDNTHYVHRITDFHICEACTLLCCIVNILEVLRPSSWRPFASFGRWLDIAKKCVFSQICFPNTLVHPIHVLKSVVFAQNMWCLTWKHYGFVKICGIWLKHHTFGYKFGWRAC